MISHIYYIYDYYIYDVITFPNAKINIGLDITACRADGYHDISTVFYPVSWRDILEIVPSSTGDDSLSVGGRGCDCPVQKNLVMKALTALRRVVEIPPVEIYLEKIIPDGAGLGGGSSDAAFTVRMLNDMFSLGLDNDTLARVVSTVGADCPFFIYNRPMHATGTGDLLTPVGIDGVEGLFIAIVKPPVSVSTREAYSMVTPSKPAFDLTEAVSLWNPAKWRREIHNRFEPSVFASHPEIAEVKTKFYEIGALYSSMSGSGASVFGLFDDDILADTLVWEFPGCDCFCAPLC